MATQKTTYLLEITVADATQEEYVFKIDNPRNDLTAQNVLDAVSYGLDEEIWRNSKTGELFTQYKKAEIVVTTITRHDVGEEP